VWLNAGRYQGDSLGVRENRTRNAREIIGKERVFVVIGKSGQLDWVKSRFEEGRTRNAPQEIPKIGGENRQEGTRGEISYLERLQKNETILQREKKKDRIKSNLPSHSKGLKGKHQLKVMGKTGTLQDRALGTGQLEVDFKGETFQVTIPFLKETWNPRKGQNRGREVTERCARKLAGKP